MAKFSFVFLLCVSCIFLGVSGRYTRGKLSGMSRMDEPDVADCLKSNHCAMTMELLPNCGSDGKSYPNRGSIECLNECLKPEEKVTIVSSGYCKEDIISSR